MLLIPAVLGKWLSGAWGVSVFDGGRFAGRTYWATFNRVGCAMIGRGELGFQLATTSRAAGILNADSYSATIWALLLATLLGPFAFRMAMRLTPCGLESLADGLKPPARDMPPAPLQHARSREGHPVSENTPSEATPTV